VADAGHISNCCKGFEERCDPAVGSIRAVIGDVVSDRIEIEFSTGGEYVLD
jgi:hypothetical protein